MLEGVSSVDPFSRISFQHQSNQALGTRTHLRPRCAYTFCFFVMLLIREKLSWAALIAAKVAFLLPSLNGGTPPNSRYSNTPQLHMSHDSSYPVCSITSGATKYIYGMRNEGTEPASSVSFSLGRRIFERPKSMTLMTHSEPPVESWSRRMFSGFRSLGLEMFPIPMKDLLGVTIDQRR